MYTKDTLGPANINREVSTSQRIIVHRKYRKIAIWVTKTCPLYGGFLYILNTECPLSEVPLYIFSAHWTTYLQCTVARGFANNEAAAG